jgi:peptidoglycan biosynthesis protein MviN/MurJ (putative lipid II flippase)
MIRKGFLAGAAAWMALTGMAAQAQSVLPKTKGGECITSTEAEGLALTVAPLVTREVVRFCAPKLPANAYLNHSEALLARLDAAAAHSEPSARGAVAKLMNAQGAGGMPLDMVMPALTTVVGPMLSKALKADECPIYDHVASLLDPMPAENTAALIVTIAQLADRDKPDSKFPICPLPKAN